MKVTRRRLLLGAGGAAAAGALYAWRIEPLWLRTCRLEVAVAGLGPGLDGFKIVQLSDVHVGSGVPEDHVADAVARANGEKPDLIALTGDFVHRGADTAEAAARLLAPLAARDGVVAVLGNHDAGVYGSGGPASRGSMERVKGALRAAGARVLVNERISCGRDGSTLHVVGLGDLWSGRFDPAAARPDGAPTVVLSHNPDTAPDLDALGVDLILSGHTHGGQVSLPFLGPPILPVRHREFHAGHFRLGRAQLYVNRGIGWLRRVRLFVRPEVTVLTLRRAPRA